MGDSLVISSSRLSPNTVQKSLNRCLTTYDLYIYNIAIHKFITIFCYIALPIGNWTPPDIDFNERFHWDAVQDMSNSYRHALKRGLPYPILTVAEYFSLGQEGFAWGGQYRAAGYYASILLW